MVCKYVSSEFIDVLVRFVSGFYCSSLILIESYWLLKC